MCGFTHNVLHYYTTCIIGTMEYKYMPISPTILAFMSFLVIYMFSTLLILIVCTHCCLYLVVSFV